MRFGIPQDLSNRKTAARSLIALLAAASLSATPLVLSGCEEESEFEEAAEEVDEGLEEAADETGDAIDEATDEDVFDDDGNIGG